MLSNKLRVAAAGLLLVGAAACTGGDNTYTGKFVDEFGNRFELKEDYTATIQWVGDTTVIPTTWSDGENHKRPYATIAFNGNPEYFFMCDGSLYRHRENMDQGRAAIELKRE